MSILSNQFAPKDTGALEPCFREMPKLHANDYGRRSSAETQERKRLLLLDADPQSSSFVRRYVLGERDFELHTVSAGKAALAGIERLRPHAILADIETVEGSGLEMAQIFRQPGKPLVVFLTARSEWALRAFDLGAVDYLLKPFCGERLRKTFDRIRAKLLSRMAASEQLKPDGSDFRSSKEPPVTELITVKGQRRTHVIDATEIEWVRAARDYTELHVGRATHLLGEPLSMLMSRLPAGMFCRIHRSFAVNLEKVAEFKALRNRDFLIRLQDETVLRASRTFSGELRRAIMQLYA